MSFFERHKPILTIFFAILLLAAIGGVFYFLRQQNEEDDLSSVQTVVEQTATQFAEALKSGDMKSAEKFCSKEGADQLVLSSMDADVYKKTLLEGLSVEEGYLPDDSKVYLNSLLDTLQAKAVTDTSFDASKMEVEKKTEEGYLVTLPMTITGCGSFNAIDFSSEISFADHAMVDFANANQEALMNHNDAFGEEGVRSLLAQQAYNNLFSTMQAKAEAYEPTARDYTLTFLVTKDDSGEFTSAKIVAAEENF